MSTMHAIPEKQTDRLTNTMALARRFVLTNASRAKTCLTPKTSANTYNVPKSDTEIQHAVTTISISYFDRGLSPGPGIFMRPGFYLSFCDNPGKTYRS